MSSEQDVIVEPITVDKEDDEVDHKNEAEVETQEPSASVDGAEEKSDPLKLLSLEHTADKKVCRSSLPLVPRPYHKKLLCANAIATFFLIAL